MNRQRYLKARLHRRTYQRRTKLFMLEKRLAQVAQRQELTVLDNENLHDLFTKLEQKVQQLIAEKQAREQGEALVVPVVGTPGKRSVWATFLQWLNSKGNP